MKPALGSGMRLPLNRSFSSDEVIRKRLLIDGDGAGDDRRINLLVKSFIKWCNSGSQEEGYLFSLGLVLFWSWNRLAGVSVENWT